MSQNFEPALGQSGNIEAASEPPASEITQPKPVLRSVYETQAEILDAIQALHCPNGFECDLTYGNGTFWKNRQKPEYCFDLTPLSDEVRPANSCNVPLADNLLNSIVFDPPFITYVKEGREHNSVMSRRFGGYYTYQELENHYVGTLKEAKRLLKKKGILVFKTQDIVHNHRLHATHNMIINNAETNRLRLLDLFILTAKNRMPSPQKGTQRHARIFHSYFLVFTKVEA